MTTHNHKQSSGGSENEPTTMQIQNELVRIDILAGSQAYHGSRFDHSGQVAQICLENNHTFLGFEFPAFNSLHGFGLLNEFDITGPIQYGETPVGACFHKIGVGALKRKEDIPYFFADNYEIESPLQWTIEQKDASQLSFQTLSPDIRGMQYHYSKTLKVDETKLIITYRLQNTGTQPIETSHYSHNFLSLDQQSTGPNMELILDHTIDASSLGEFVNPENCINLQSSQLSWKDVPKSDFFIENLLYKAKGFTSWTLKNHSSKTLISEEFEFTPTHMNFWGRAHVISPEVFHHIQINPSETATWSRTFSVSKF